MLDVGDAGEWAVGYTIEFDDGGPSLSCILGFAPEETAKNAVVKIALTGFPYTGPRPASTAVLFTCPAEGLR